MKKKRIHAIVLARGGSKGIKNKNIVIVNKKPLIYWSIKNSLKSKLIDKTWVSSDNDKILKDIGYGRRVVGVSTTFSSANVGSATITFDRPHGFGSIKFRNSITSIALARISSSCCLTVLSPNNA